MSKYKVYLAILNSGWLRREISHHVLPMMANTKGVELVWEEPGKTWANPISSNRNSITKRFLESDCTHLLMIDDDVVPLHNPAELVYADKDIVGSPARVRSTGQIIVWTAYIDHVSGEGYSAIEIDALDDMFDLLEVKIVGTGCILIKRKVLEDLKAPFHSEFDDDGIQVYGTDFAFCRKALKAGFRVYTTTHRRCEHYKKIGLNEIEGWDAVENYDASNSLYEKAWGGWSITQKDWRFIRPIIEKVIPKRILEFGCGLSSLLMSELTEVVCYETNPDYKKEIESKCTEKNNLKIILWDGKQIDGLHQMASDEKFDLAFVDGPVGISSGGVGRDASIHIASEHADRIIVHDAGRQAEVFHQKKHLRGVFKLVRKSGYHITRCNYWVRREKPVTNADLKLPELKAKEEV